MKRGLMLSHKNEHKRDRYVKLDPYYENNHVYLIHGKSHLEKGYKSVTNFIKKFFDEFDADEVIDKYYDKWQNNNHPEYFGKSKDEIKEMWNKKRDDAAADGTEMHQLFEDYANGYIWNTSQLKFMQEAVNWVNWFKLNDITPWRTEYTVYGAKEKLVGNIDLIFLNKYGEFCIADYKRTELPNTQTYGRVCDGIDLPHNTKSKHIIQLNIYKQLLEKYYGLEIKHLYNIYAKNDLFEVVKQPIVEVKL